MCDRSRYVTRESRVSHGNQSHPTLTSPTQPLPCLPFYLDLVQFQSQVANARAALTAAQNAGPGEGWLGDVLGLEEAR